MLTLPEVRDISLVSYLWRSLWWKRLEEEVCFKSKVKKRRSKQKMHHCARNEIGL